MTLSRDWTIWQGRTDASGSILGVAGSKFRTVLYGSCASGDVQSMHILSCLTTSVGGWGRWWLATAGGQAGG